MNNIFYHRGSMGDIIYALPTIISLSGGGLILGKENHYDFLKDLLIIQPYIDYVIPLKYWKKWNNITHNLDQFRPINRKHKNFHLAKCHLFPFNIKYDLSLPWLYNIDKLFIKKIVINYTPRYHDKKLLNWKILNEFRDDCIFIGLHDEYSIFSNKFNINIDYYECNSGLEMAKIINGSKFFIGNQSMAFSIAEGLKVPRGLEVCYNQPNCYPNSENGYIDINITYDIINNYIKD